MMEVAEESTHVPSHKQRTILFLSAMRHFAAELASRGVRVRYARLDETENTQSFGAEIVRACELLRPERLSVIEPGEWRVRRAIEHAANQLQIALDTGTDEHFLTTVDEFRGWASGRKQLVLEQFYRWQRKRLDVLMTGSGKPRGGEWNFDKENRSAFKRAPNPGKVYQPRCSEITKEVIELVERRFPDAPGESQPFRWAVTRDQAKRALSDFIENRLPRFGTYQDAMWTDEPFLYHSLLSPALNLKLLDPRECVEAAVQALDDGRAPIHCVEGFVRQIIGWREFIRGVYWHCGPEYAARNALEEDGELPAFYWSGETDMHCVRQCIGQVVSGAYGHHIQRLMVTGNFGLIAGVHPRAVSDWYLSMFADAVDWVTLPNALGMVMHADGGVVGTKPYAASGKYIQRMSNYCEGCRYDVTARTGEDACPFNTFYWDFLLRHRARFADNHRMAMMLKNVDRLSAEEKRSIRERADRLRAEFRIV